VKNTKLFFTTCNNYWKKIAYQATDTTEKSIEYEYESKKMKEGEKTNKKLKRRRS